MRGGIIPSSAAAGWNAPAVAEAATLPASGVGEVAPADGARVLIGFED
jgi:hypothetical protein